jgi:hypothetical protein
MTEEILQAAILKLRSKALEQYGIIKDVYHRPATTESVDKIAQHALALAQIEGAIITLQQYSGNLAKQTEAEAVSNTPEEPEEEPKQISGEEILKRSATARKAQAASKIKRRTKKKEEQ